MSHTPPDDKFQVIVYRGGLPQFVPVDRVPSILQAKSKGEMVVLRLNGGMHSIDTVGIEQIIPFSAWREAMNLKLGGRKYVCSCGSLHEESERCQCPWEGRIPLIEKVARKILAKCEEVDAMTPEQKREFRETAGNADIESLLAAGYPALVEEIWNPLFALPSQAHDQIQ